VTAPAGTVSNPLIVTLVVDASLIPPGVDPFTIQVFKDGAVIPPCTGPFGQAVPDPCVEEKVLQPDGDLFFVILTSDADFNFGTPICGDGITEAGEQCDDSNTVSGDGCSSTCQTEVCPTCPAIDLVNQTQPPLRPVGRPGGVACLFTKLTSNSRSVTATSNDVGLLSTPFAVDSCTITPLLGASPSSKTLQNSVVGPGATERIAIYGLNTATIPDGILYQCDLGIPFGSVLGTYELSNSNVGAADVNGDIPGAGGGATQVRLTTCTGDCDGSGDVTPGEVFKVVQILLQPGGLGKPLCIVTQPTLSCPVADADLNGKITIGEVQLSINNYLNNGCP
jgi:cysteine-rich repeat protein